MREVKDMKEETKWVIAEREVRKADETGREGKKEKNQGKSGMDADFCQQEVNVSMVTRQRSDVIASNRCLAWWGYFWGLAVRVCSSPSAVYCCTSREKWRQSCKWLCVFGNFQFYLAFTDNKRCALAWHQTFPVCANIITLQFPLNTFSESFPPSLFLILHIQKKWSQNICSNISRAATMNCHYQLIGLLFSQIH